MIRFRSVPLRSQGVELAAAIGVRHLCIIPLALAGELVGGSPSRGGYIA